jgi:hypothetical protein
MCEKNLICGTADFIALKHAVHPLFTRKIRTSSSTGTFTDQSSFDPKFRRCAMMKTFTGIAAAAALAITAVAMPQPAQARHGGAVAAGVIGGLAAGAIIGSAVANSPRYGYAYAPGPVYYGPGCYWTRERYWNGWRWRSHRIRVCR